MSEQKTERSDEWIVELKEQMRRELWALPLEEQILQTRFFVSENSRIIDPNRENNWEKFGF